MFTLINIIYSNDHLEEPNLGDRHDTNSACSQTSLTFGRRHFVKNCHFADDLF